MTADDLLTWRIRLGLIQREAAAELKTPISSYRKWEQGIYTIPRVVEVACNCVERHLRSRKKK